ncbi:MAG: rod shape-determining protein MreD [Acidimicrobiales bacterium]
MSPHLAARLRIALVILVAILLETTLGSDVRVAQVAPDLMALVAICAGLAGGAEAGAWVGFWCGLVADLFLTSTPLGLSALTFCLVGAGVGALRASVLPDSRLVTPLAAVAGTVVAVLLFVVVGDVLGQSQLLGSGKAWLVRVIVIEAGWAAVLSLPVSWLYNRAARGSVGTDWTGTGGRGGTRVDKVPAR